MATEKWSPPASRGNVLTTELNSLADSSYSVPGPAYDNTSNLDMWGVAALSVTFGVSPTADAPVILFAVLSFDGGATYQDGGLSLRYPDSAYLGSFQVYNTTNSQVLMTRPFRLMPAFMKFTLGNFSGQAFPFSGSTVSLYTFNRVIN